MTADNATGRRRRWWVLGGLVAITVVVTGVVLAWGGREGGVSAPVWVTEPVGRASLEEVVVTRGVIGHSGLDLLESGGAGRITRLDMQVGEVVEPGMVLWRLDGRPAVAATGDTPLWRDLSQDMSGDDVTVLQETLASQGVDVDVTGSFDAATTQAVKQWQQAHGHTDPDGVFRLSDIVVTQLPARVGSHAVDVGAFVEASTVIMTTTATDTSVTVELNPSDRARVEQGDDVRVTLSATGETVEGELSAASVQPQTRDDGSTFYPADVTLPDDTFDEVDGAQAQVTIIIERADNALVVPVAAVVATQDGGSGVRVVTGRDAAQVVEVELGLSQGGQVEVVTGLDGSEEVVVAQVGADDDAEADQL